MFIAVERIGEFYIITIKHNKYPSNTSAGINAIHTDSYHLEQILEIAPYGREHPCGNKQYHFAWAPSPKVEFFLA